MLRYIVEHWKDIIAIGTTLSALVVGVYKFIQKVIVPLIEWVRKIRDWINEQDEHREMVTLTLKELELNGGLSMKDTVNHIAELVEIIKARQTGIMHEMATAMYENDGHGVCIAVNRAWCELTGLDREDAIGTGWSRIIHPDDVERLIRAAEDFVKHGVSYNDTFKIIHFQTNEVLAVRATAYKVFDKKGKTVSIIGTMEII